MFLMFLMLFVLFVLSFLSMTFSSMMAVVLRTGLQQIRTGGYRDRNSTDEPASRVHQHNPVRNHPDCASTHHGRSLPAFFVPWPP